MNIAHRILLYACTFLLLAVLWFQWTNQEYLWKEILFVENEAFTSQVYADNRVCVLEHHLNKHHQQIEKLVGLKDLFDDAWQVVHERYAKIESELATLRKAQCKCLCPQQNR